MITFLLSANKLNIIDSCWELYNLNYNKRWAPKDNDAPLDNGTVVHAVLGYFYRQKMAGRLRRSLEEFGIVLDEACNVARRTGADLSISVDEIDEAIKAARESLLFHKMDGMEVHAVEQPFTKVLYETRDQEVDGAKVHGVRILWEGRVDLVATLPNQPLSVWDHKSESRRSNPSRLDNQFEGSAWAFAVDTVVVNKVGFQSSVKPEEKFRRVFLEYNNREILEEWRLDAIKSALAAIERHRREAFGKPDWPRNRTSCNKFSGCRFRPVCGAIPAVREVKLQTWYRIRPEHELYDRDQLVSQPTGVEPE